MEFKKKILPNGLVILGEVNKTAKSAAVGFFVKTGARDETKDINGVSHFLEHMLFKGNEKLSAIQVNEAFDRTGAQFNAFTSEEMTVFYSAVLPEYLADVTGLWIDIMRPELRDKDFDIEKNVIKEEIAMYKDLPSFDVMDRCRNLYFGQHPCGNSVLGSEESINNLTATQMRDYFANRYSPNNIILAIAGNFDWEHICSIVEAPCGSWQRQSVTRKLEHSWGSKKKVRIEKPSLTCEHICLMSASVSAQAPERFAASLLATVIGDDVGSRFFWELVDKAIAETAMMQFGSMDGTGAFYSYIRCNSKNVPKILGIIEGIFLDLTQNGINESELQKAKNKTLSALVIKNELSMGRLLDLGFNWTYLEEYRKVEEDINAIKAVTIDEVNSLIKQYDPNNFTQFSIAPANK